MTEPAGRLGGPDAASSATRPAAQPAIAWSWPSALLGAAYALPGAVAMFWDVSLGLAFEVGVLPAAILGLPPTRQGRRMLFVVGALVGVPMAIGSVLAQVPVVAVLALVGLGVGAVALAQRFPMGRIAIVLGLPMVAIGFSYDELATAFGAAGLMIVGSIYAGSVSMAWPERPAPARPAGPPPPALEYGVRIGLAGATAAVIGFALDLDHVGWACGAALLVMRPQAEMQRIRSVGRIASVALGATVAVVVVGGQPGPAVYAAVVVAAIAGAAATHGSRWYVTAAFTTCIVFLLLLHASPEDSAYRWGERVGETLLGVTIAYGFGILVPLARQRLRPGAAAADSR